MANSPAQTDSKHTGQREVPVQRLALNGLQAVWKFRHNLSPPFSGDHRPIANLITRAATAETEAGFQVNGTDEDAGTFDHGPYLDISDGCGKGCEDDNFSDLS